MSPRKRGRPRKEPLLESVKETVVEETIVEETANQLSAEPENLTENLSQEEPAEDEGKQQSAVESQVITKPFIEVEEYKPTQQLDAVFIDSNLDKMYRLRWLKKAVLGSNRKGIWHVVDKTHDHFTPKVLRVEVDHTPKKTYYSNNEMVLCVTRQETAQGKRKAIQDKTNMQTRSIKEQFAMESEKALADGGLQPQREPTFGDITERRGNVQSMANFR